MEPLEKKITEIEKTPSELFKFFLNKINDKNDLQLFNQYLTSPKIPLIGLYNNKEYTFGNVLCLSMFTYDILQGKNKDKVVNNNKGFEPPKEVTEYLNINAKLKIENNTKSTGKNYFYPQEKIHFYFVISTLPKTNKKDNYKYDDIIFNIVPHCFLLGDKEGFSKGEKRIAFEYPICIFQTSPYGSTVLNPINENKRYIYVNDLRLEYSHIHFKGAGLAFSPNNLMFRLDKNKILSQFYVVTCILEHKCHYVFYYIVSHSDDTNKKLEEILDKSKTLKEVILNMKEKFGSKAKDIIDNLTSIFKEEK